MYYWQSKARSSSPIAVGEVSPVIPVMVEGSEGSSRGIGVRLPNGIQLFLGEAFDLPQLGRIVSALMEVRL